MSTAVLRTSIEEFLARPEREDGFREELIEGELVVSPNVKRGHSELVRRLYRMLLPLEEHGFVVVTEFACFLAEASIESLPNPDLGVLPVEQWNAIDSDKWLEQAPELTIEVASPGNRRLARKAALYLEHGARQVWLVFPNSRNVLVYTADGEMRDAGQRDTVEFHGVTVAVADLFA